MQRSRPVLFYIRKRINNASQAISYLGIAYHGKRSEVGTLRKIAILK
ncbi:MAG: hypothetical protein R2814_18665 [Flavobacteriaceae bacterium]